ncbi:MAG: hypothetical protein E7504_05000 [Ruminococcus sp.]|nr:hypothetical protein [Ruminococcus sp.]
MLKILEQTNHEPYRAVLDAISTEYPLYLTEALDGEQVTGYIVYAYEPEAVAIHTVNDGGDLYLCDGLVRSVLFKGLLRGLNRAVFLLKDDGMMQNMQKLRFVKNDENTLGNIAEIMDNCKSCRKS